ncbi:unnamed protein product [Urochloa humidicola]
MDSKKRTQWDQYDIGHCINLTLANIQRNDSLLITSSYFWSDALNAFLFGHGPMAPSLADVVMLTGLNITSTKSYDLLAKPTHKIETSKIGGGWSGYMETFAKSSGTIDHREHTAFLLMWLEKFLFCGKTFGPSNKFLKLAEHLASGNDFPLGKCLLGSVYRLLHEVSLRLRNNQPIPSLGGPWWFINLWLNVHMTRVLNIDLVRCKFPVTQLESADPKSRRCISFGEAAATFDHVETNPDRLASYFCCFYNGLNKQVLTWHAYEDPNHNFEFPYNFKFDEANQADKQAIFKEMICPNILPIISRNIDSYEFYNPSVIARQLGFCQGPIKLYFADLIRPRDSIPTGLAYHRLLDRVPAVNMDILTSWKYTHFGSKVFKKWWLEWCSHIFCKSAATFSRIFDPSFVGPPEVLYYSLLLISFSMKKY